jgi:hypothetical protein
MNWFQSLLANGFSLYRYSSVALRALTYERLCNTSAHKGQWWLPEAAGTEVGGWLYTR